MHASCGQCNLGLKGAGCKLAVEIDGQSYFVEGAKMDHRAAHGKHGMCSTIRKAKVKGEVVDGKFVAEEFELLPYAEAKED